jgi:hypothetical protein
MEVPPNIEGQPTVSTLSTALSHSSNRALLKDDSNLLLFSHYWQATCSYVLHDPGHHTFSNFSGSLKCVNCRGVMEIQTMRGVLIWGYPLSGMNPDFAARPYEYNLYAGQKKI